MLHVYEFEVFDDDGVLVALPFDFEGGTQGADTREVAEMAADWLKTEIEQRIISGEEVPIETLGHEPEREGGRILIVAVDASIDTVDAVSASEAARMLGVSNGRVSQMVKAGKLQGFKKGRDSFVTRASIEQRIAEAPKAGRPRLISSSESELERYGVGTGSQTYAEYECPCGKGKIVDDHDDIPGFRSHDIFIACDECREKYDIDRSRGASNWRLVEKAKA